METRHLSIHIARDWRVVYDYVCVPEHFSDWATGLGTGLRRVGADWIAATPEGEACVRFSPRNDYGVLDHWVTLASGHTLYIPLRVIAHGEGAEVTLTLLRLPQMSDAEFERDSEWVLRDLARLKARLEARALHS